ncbi:MAG: hypothetical protein ACOVQT_08785 [Rubrivivax sp.]|jgi:hypothetical protein
MTATLRFIVATTALAWTLTACGPGSAGTGTGAPPISLSDFGAMASDVCAAPFAMQIGCARLTTDNPNAPPPPQGSTLTTYADSAAGGQITVVFEANSVRLEARCQRLVFVGDWGITAARDARFFGQYTVEGQAAPVAASLSVATTPVFGQLQVTLSDTSGRTVLAVVVVQRVAVIPAPAPVPALCP